VESFGAKALVPTGRLRALLEHLGITIATRYRIKEVPHPGWVELKAIADIFFRSRVLCRHKGPAFRASHSDVVADAAWQAIKSWVHSNKSRLQNFIHHLLPYRKNDQFKAYGGEEGYPQDGYGAPPGCDSGAEHSSTGRSVRDRDSLHPVAERGRHHPRLHEEGIGLGQ
jgi:hypothetical protein